MRERIRAEEEQSREGSGGVQSWEHSEHFESPEGAEWVRGVQGRSPLVNGFILALVKRLRKAVTRTGSLRFRDAESRTAGSGKAFSQRSVAQAGELGILGFDCGALGQRVGEGCFG